MGCDLWILKKYSGFNIKTYLLKVPIKTIGITILASILPVILANTLSEGWINFVSTVILCVLCTIVLVFYFGLDIEMRQKVKQKTFSFLHFRQS